MAAVPPFVSRAALTSTIAPPMVLRTVPSTNVSRGSPMHGARERTDGRSGIESVFH